MDGFFTWIQDAADWLLRFAQDHPEAAFLIAFVVSFGESFAGLSFLVPGTTILIGIGAMLRVLDVGLLAFWPVWLAAAVGAILGDWISYWFGHRYHEHVLDMWPVRKYRDQMKTALQFFERWGVWAIFIGRFMGPFRATVPLVAGVARMKFWPFQIANISSALIWSASLLLLGAVGWDAIKTAWHWLPGWAMALLAVAIVLGVVFHRRIIAAARGLTH
ncbi:MAG: DedA family protein [Alphaproteobacteria bacterium]|nr:DedA family protein [Alphaproteobacteria bacterium]